MPLRIGCKVRYIITRDVEGYANSGIQAVQPSDFFRIMEQ